MSRRFVRWFALAAMLLSVNGNLPQAFADGFKGMSRPAGGKIPHSVGARPSAGNMARPTPMPRPTPSTRPMPSTRPTPPSTRPAPVPTRPVPSTRPSFPSPSTPQLPSVKPSYPRPGSGLKPSVPSTKPSIPSSKPSFPIPTNPSVRPMPGNASGNLPGIRPPESIKPGVRPTYPGLGGTKPAKPPVSTLPSLPSKPSKPPARPLPGNVEDFLGLDRPVTLPGVIGGKPLPKPSLPRPEIPSTKPSLPQKPSIPSFPSTKPAPLPPSTKPSRPLPSKPGWNNDLIHQRPGWVNIDNSQITIINNNWQNQINSISNWHVQHPQRIASWQSWGDQVRVQWGGRYHYSYQWFSPTWWTTHPHGMCGWHYYYRYQYYPVTYWWAAPTFSTFTNWFTWSAPSNVWAQPVYYDYGTGGNITYQNNYVYLNGQQLGTAREFAESAATLATVPPPATEEQAEQAEWLPLGTFALTTNKQDTEPNRVLQLAVNKEGILSGTIYNTQTEESQAIQGSVDKETQRVAFRFGENENVVAETGLFNLTQNETPLLIHFGPDWNETYLLVRLEAPAEEATE